MKRVLLIVFFAAACAGDGEVADQSANHPSTYLDLGKGLLGLEGSGIYLQRGKNDRAGDYEWKEGDRRGYGARVLDGYRNDGYRGYEEGGNIIGYLGYDEKDLSEERRNEEYYRIGYEEPRRYRPRDRYYEERRNRKDDKDDEDKDSDRKYKDRGYDDRDYGDFESGYPIPELVGRQGLGLQRRDKFSDGYRYPTTLYLLKPIGYRNLIKDYDFEPLKN